MKNGEINAYFSRIPPIKVNANSKKSAFDQSAGVSAVCAKVSQYISDSGKQKFYNLGRYPSISLSDARDRCRKIRTAIHQGQDPQIEVQQRYGSVSDLIDYYLKCMVNDGKRTWQKVGADLNFNCKDILHLQAKDITPAHIKKYFITLFPEARMFKQTGYGHIWAGHLNLVFTTTTTPKIYQVTLPFNLQTTLLMPYRKIQVLRCQEREIYRLRKSGQFGNTLTCKSNFIWQLSY